MKKITALGSTGSIDTQTLEAVRCNEGIQATVLAADGNVKLMEEQIREFKSRLVCLWDEEEARKLRVAMADLDVKVTSGVERLVEAVASPEANLVVVVVVGVIGIRPVIIAIKVGRDIALANRETLVIAGHIIMPLARGRGVKLLPVDSEHSAIFQCLQGAAGNPPHRILLVASGGPSRGFIGEQLKQVRLEDALKHPNWSMGHRVTIDSSTMVNKGLKVMEIHWPFGVETDQVQVVVQPASIIRSMVEFEDGAVITRLGTPDIKLPIQYALYYLERRLPPGKRLDFAKPGQIASEVPDMETFRGLRLAYKAGRRGDTLPTAFNVANEMATALFPERKVSHFTIVGMIERAMEHHYVKPSPDVAQTLETEQKTYNCVRSKWN